MAFLSEYSQILLKLALLTLGGFSQKVTASQNKSDMGSAGNCKTDLLLLYGLKQAKIFLIDRDNKRLKSFLFVVTGWSLRPRRSEVYLSKVHR